MHRIIFFFFGRKEHVAAGVQPDMVVFTRMEIMFCLPMKESSGEGYNSGHFLVDAGVLIKPKTAPSVDLEPEYVAVSQDGKTAYVFLQGANAIATLDIATGQFTRIKGLGFKDHSAVGNALDLNNNGQIKILNGEVLGIFPPDGIVTVNIEGTQYVLTANKGDPRKWSSYEDIGRKVINGSAKKWNINITCTLPKGR